MNTIGDMMIGTDRLKIEEQWDTLDIAIFSGKWLKNIAVTVGQNLNSMKHCSKFKGPGKNGQVIELTCKSPIAGRYVKILRSGKGILGLAEVQVMGNTGKNSDILFWKTSIYLVLCFLLILAQLTFKQK